MGIAKKPAPKTEDAEAAFIAGDKPAAVAEPEPENLVLTAFRFDPDDLRRLAKLARKQRVPRAHLVRLAVRRLLDDEEDQISLGGKR
jgi:Ribbon-helix-helix protein, copG family